MRETASFAADDARIRFIGQVFDDGTANDAGLSYLGEQFDAV